MRLDRWLLPVPTALGLYGALRVQLGGVDDLSSWLLLPLLGFTVTGCALTAIMYGLMTEVTCCASLAMTIISLPTASCLLRTVCRATRRRFGLGAGLGLMGTIVWRRRGQPD